MEKFIERLGEAEKTIQAMDHLIHVTFPIVRDKKMLLGILEKTGQAVIICINSILQYDYLYKRIRISQNKAKNLQTFKEKCAPRYGLNKDEITNLVKLINLIELHKKSPMEFTRDNKIIILSENMVPETINVEKVKEFITTAKNLVIKIRNYLKTNYY